MSRIEVKYCKSCHVSCGHRYVKTTGGHEVWVCRVCGNVKHIRVR